MCLHRVSMREVNVYLSAAPAVPDCSITLNSFSSGRPCTRYPPAASPALSWRKRDAASSGRAPAGRNEKPASKNTKNASGLGFLRMLRRAPKRLRSVFRADRGVYDLEKAKRAHAEIAAIDKRKLCTAGEITKLPYPGIGEPPGRPGGDISFIGRPDLIQLLEAAADPSTAVLLITGPFGIGKSCLLRALACFWIKDSAGTSTKVVCIWALDKDDLVGCVKNALRFTYCGNPDQQDIIEALSSKEDIHRFFCHRIAAAGERFCFIIDQAELSSVGEDVPQKERREKLRRDMEYLVSVGILVVYGLSPRAGITKEYLVDSKEVVIMEDGFGKEELDAFKNKLSLLGLLCSRFPERAKLVNYYTGRHPFSLAVLDRSCRRYASSRLRPQPDFFGKSFWSLKAQIQTEWKEPTIDEAVALLEDDDEWEAAIETFLSSGEMEGIRSSLEYLLRICRPQRAYHKIEDMVSLDTRFIVGDDKEGYEFVTEYIGQIYAEEFRAAEKLMGL